MPTVLPRTNAPQPTANLLCGQAAGELEQALHARQPNDSPERFVHHSNRGSQYLAIRYTDRLAAAGIAASGGSRGDSYDNALAEAVIGLFKTEVLGPQGPWRDLGHVEYATLDWVHWFNTQRLLEPLGYLPRRSSRRSITPRSHRRPPRKWPDSPIHRASGQGGAVQAASAAVICVHA